MMIKGRAAEHPVGRELYGKSTNPSAAHVPGRALWMPVVVFASLNLGLRACLSASEGGS